MGIRLNLDFWDDKPHSVSNSNLPGTYAASLSHIQTAATLDIQGAELLVPGDPGKSILLQRQLRRETYAQDLANWEADPSPDSITPVGIHERNGIRIAHQVIESGVILVGIQGRKIFLSRVTDNTFAIPSDLPRGLYSLFVKGQALGRFVF